MSAPRPLPSVNERKRKRELQAAASVASEIVPARHLPSPRQEAEWRRNMAGMVPPRSEREREWRQFTLVGRVLATEGAVPVARSRPLTRPALMTRQTERMAQAHMREIDACLSAPVELREFVEAAVEVLAQESLRETFLATDAIIAVRLIERRPGAGLFQSVFSPQLIVGEVGAAARFYPSHDSSENVLVYRIDLPGPTPQQWRLLQYDAYTALGASAGSTNSPLLFGAGTRDTPAWRALAEPVTLAEPITANELERLFRAALQQCAAFLVRHAGRHPPLHLHVEPGASTVAELSAHLRLYQRRLQRCNVPEQWKEHPWTARRIVRGMDAAFDRDVENMRGPVDNTYKRTMRFLIDGYGWFDVKWPWPVGLTRFTVEPEYAASDDDEENAEGDAGGWDDGGGVSDDENNN